jgi:hypothetical protein
VSKQLFPCAGLPAGGQPPVPHSLQETSPGYRREGQHSQMSRLTLAAYDQLCKDINDWIQKAGYVPPVRTLADQFECSPVTAWRIVKSQGWVAKGHHWEEVQQSEKERVAG